MAHIHSLTLPPSPSPIELPRHQIFQGVFPPWSGEQCYQSRKPTCGLVRRDLYVLKSIFEVCWREPHLLFRDVLAPESFVLKENKTSFAPHGPGNGGCKRL